MTLSATMHQDSVIIEFNMMVCKPLEHQVECSRHANVMSQHHV
jgi:hypothetical protein